MDIQYAAMCEKETGRKFYYIVRCDDENAPVSIKPDMYFELWQYNDLYRILQICEENKLNYDFAIQSFNPKNDCIEQEIAFISKNCKNQ